MPVMLTLSLLMLPAGAGAVPDSAERATPAGPVAVTSPVESIPGEYWKAPFTTFRRLEGDVTRGVTATVYPQPVKPGGPVNVLIRHPDEFRVLRVRIDLGEGLPRVVEYPRAMKGYTLVAVDVPEDHPADSLHITIWLPGETVAKAVAVVRDGRRRAPRFGDYVHVDELPEAIHKVPPVYPDTPSKLRESGTVLVQVLVGEDGLVHDHRVVKSVPLLDQAAVNAARQWRFKPARSGGTPVAVWVAIPITFTVH